MKQIFALIFYLLFYNFTIAQNIAFEYDTAGNRVKRKATGTLLLNAKVLLRGPYNSVSQEMNTPLASAGFLPTTSPYSGNSATNNSVNTLSVSGKRVVDWVKVELRSNSSPFILKDSKPGLLISNGTIVDPVTLTNISFAGDPGLYLLVISHRNHLAVATKITLAAGGFINSYDFSVQSSVTTQQASVSSKKLLWHGDVNSDDYVDSQDYSILLAQFDLSPFDGYFIADVNLDGYVDAIDMSMGTVSFNTGPFLDYEEL